MLGLRVFLGLSVIGIGLVLASRLHADWAEGLIDEASTNPVPGPEYMHSRSAELTRLPPKLMRRLGKLLAFSAPLAAIVVQVRWG